MGHYAHHLELSVLGRRPAEVEARTGSGKIKERKSMSALLKLLGESTEHAGGELDLYLIDQSQREETKEGVHPSLASPSVIASLWTLGLLLLAC
jgi:hypothetical protein